MANIKIVVNGPLMDGHKLTFKAPCNCDVVDKLDVRYIKNDTQASKLFTMKDTHGNDLTGLGNLFYKDSYVSVVLDTVNNFAYLQNAATNKYLEEKLGNSGGGGSNPNLLINGDFRVNQRNSTVVYSNNWSNVVYTVDRWHILGGGRKSANVTVNDGSITLKNTIGGQGAHFRQHLEESVYGTYTLTVKVKNLTGEAWARTQSAMLEQLHVGINTITFTDTPTTVGVSVEGVSSMEIEYIKLEQGAIATPFIPRHYTEELLLCKRYFQNLYLSKRPPYLEKKYFGGMQYQVPMRVDPTVTYLMKDERNNDISSDVKIVSCDNNQILEIVTNSEHDSIYGYLSADSEIY